MPPFFQIKGVEAVLKSLGDAANATPPEAAMALYACGEEVKTTSMQDTPILTGVLSGSHEVSKPVISEGGARIEVAIGVGGPAIGYAVYVHEDLTAFHKVGHAKFLENASNAKKATLDNDVADKIKLARIFK